MDTLAHVTAGYFLTKTLISLEEDEEITKDTSKWLRWGVFCSQIPDLDEYIGLIVSKERRTRQFTKGSPHHGELSHLPFFYIGTVLITLIPCIYFKNRNLTFGLKVFIVNVMAHLTMDSFGMGEGLRWFYPFKKEQVGIDLTKKTGPNDWKEFYFSRRVLYELMVFFLAAYEVYWEKQK